MFITLLIFSLLLSVTIYKGVLYLGIISSSSKWDTLSAVLSAKASGHPLYQSTHSIIYLLPDRVLVYGPDTSSPNSAEG